MNRLTSVSIALSLLLGGGAALAATPSAPTVLVASAATTAHEKAQATSVVAAYDRARAALAGDDATAAAKAGAEARTAAAKAGHAFHAVAEEAGKLASANDIAAQRRAFGGLSKALITVLAADATLAKGVTCYECGMADGYQKWIQPSGKLANPYMGKRMLRCGAKTELKP